MAEKYNTSTDDLTCSCPDFIETRAHLAKENPERLCKHLIRAIDDPYDLFDPEIAELIYILDGQDSGFPHGDLFVKEYQSNRVFIAIKKDRSNPWVNTYVDDERYGFNVHEERWSYKNTPEHAKQIEAWIIKKWQAHNPAERSGGNASSNRQSERNENSGCISVILLLLAFLVVLII